jgi:hypothetical protein
MHGNENWVNVGTRVAWDLDDVLYAKFANILNSSAGNLMEIGWRMVNGCADLTFSNVVFDDVATWWDFGPGTTDIEIGNHTHRGAVTTKYKFDASITDEQKLRNFFIHKHNANFAAGVLLVDPYNRRVGVGTQTPAKDLHVYNPSTIAEARIQSGASSASSARLSLLHHGSSASQQWDVKGETDGSFRVRDVTGGHDRLAIGSDGLMQFGTHAAITGETLSGYILIRDEAGNLRKVAVVS